MNSKSARATAAVCVLVLAGVLLFALSDDDPALANDATAEVKPRTSPTRTSAGAPPPPSSSVPEPEEEEEALRIRAPTQPDAGLSPDGGSMRDLLDTVGKQAALQFLEDNAAAAEKHVDRYCAETKDLVTRKELADPPRKRDAAIYMAGRSDWEGGRIGLLHLPPSITQRMANNAWRTAGPELYAGLDFTWMTELLQFDHWSLLGAGPLRDQKVENFYAENIPNYVTLQTWAKLRLLKGVHEGNLAQASVEVRHLSNLIATNGTLIGEMIRLAITGIERKTWEDAGLQMPDGLPTADEAWRLRHSAFAGMYLLYPGVPREVKEKALKCIPMHCAALMEAIGATASFRGLIPNVQQELDWLQAQNPCDPAVAARAASSPPSSSEDLAQNHSGDLGLLRSLQSMTDGGL